MPRAAAHNADIARLFGEIADLLEIQQANPFRIRAYRNAARIVEGCRLIWPRASPQAASCPSCPA